ncbi:hypothetical protein [Cellulomonas sp. Y8]|uniref:hypothetical protein n=1 Tax=Cellulomonas sp. Y8 TaxID=2591145 RepID=UPI0011C7C4F3|nr:hypothetical protein [Cellulomonas sp. Y8]
MKRPQVTRSAAVVVGLGLWAGALSAHALWSDSRDGVEPSKRTGAVTFAGQVPGEDASRVVSDGGAPVTVVLPGSEIARVVGDEGGTTGPLFWRFEAAGAALGITGLVFDVTVGSTVAGDGTVTDIADGVAPDGTVLGGSVIKLYPAALGGDCSAVPATPPGEEHKNVLVIGGEQDVLQAAGTNRAGDEVVREWCVAMSWLEEQDGLYANRVEAAGVATDGSAVLALDDWQAAVAFPRSLPDGAVYGNLATAEAVGVGGTALRDSSEWHALLSPDPSAEPDVVITLDPAVTNLNPDVGTGDQPVFPAR